MKRTFLAGCLTVLAASGAAMADTIVAVTETNRVLTFDADRPGTIISSLPITGLNPADTILGIDVRPANGLLYVLGSGGRLYTLDPNTGAATLLFTLAADSLDITSPFTALDGTDFGIDFNPVPDRLRGREQHGAEPARQPGHRPRDHGHEPRVRGDRRELRQPAGRR